MISAGQLNKRVTIQTPTKTQDSAYGSEQLAWTDSATVWAAIDGIGDASAREQGIAKTFATTVSHRLKIRYRAGLKPTYRFKYGTRYFYFNGMTNPEEANVALIVYCTEVQK